MANLFAVIVYGCDKLTPGRTAGACPRPRWSCGALIGGIGAWIGCNVLRHKTRKTSFRTPLIFAVSLYLCLVTAVTLFWPRL